MPSEVDEAYDKIQRFAEEIMEDYMKTTPKKVQWLLRYRREALFHVLTRMVQNGLIANFDVNEGKIYME